MFAPKSNINQYIGLYIQIKILNVSVSLLFSFYRYKPLKCTFLKGGMLEKKEIKRKKPGQICPLILKCLTSKLMNLQKSDFRV